MNCDLLMPLQVQSLPNLTGFLTIGTTACLTALGITIAKLAQHPVPGVSTPLERAPCRLLPVWTCYLAL